MPARSARMSAGCRPVALPFPLAAAVPAHGFLQIYFVESPNNQNRAEARLPGRGALVGAACRGAGMDGPGPAGGALPGQHAHNR